MTKHSFLKHSRALSTAGLQWGVRAAYLLLLLAILYLSLRGSPSLREVCWLPGWLSAWADRHGELRTAVPYCAAGLLCPWLLTRNQAPPTGRSQLIGHGRLAPILWAAASLFVLLLLTEGAQLVLPNRLASLADVAWGTLGIVVGVAGSLCLRAVAQRRGLELEREGS
jgi:hypothetical protein